jgi:hypothetical protein
MEGAMGYKKRTYKIEEAVTGGPPQDNPVLSYNGQVIPPNVLLIFNKNTDNMRKVDHYRLRFDIKGFGDSRLRFVPDIQNVLWAHRGSACPTEQCAMPGVFWVDDMDGDGEWIDIINMDMDAEEFWFTLNLVDKNNPTSTNYVPLDPGGGNQNGGSSGSGFSFGSLFSG